MAQRKAMGRFDAPIRCGYVGTVMKIPSIAVVVYSLSHVRLFATPRTVAHQAPLSMKYWSGLPFPPQSMDNTLLILLFLIICKDLGWGEGRYSFTSACICVLS